MKIYKAFIKVLKQNKGQARYVCLAELWKQFLKTKILNMNHDKLYIDFFHFYL